VTALVLSPLSLFLSLSFSLSLSLSFFLSFFFSLFLSFFSFFLLSLEFFIFLERSDAKRAEVPSQRVGSSHNNNKPITNTEKNKTLFQDDVLGEMEALRRRWSQLYDAAFNGGGNQVPTCKEKKLELTCCAGSFHINPQVFGERGPSRYVQRDKYLPMFAPRNVG